jgi:hypothetical protein
VFPKLHGETQVKLEPSRLYLPARMQVVTNADIQKLEEIMRTASKTRWHPLQNVRTSANLRCWFSPTSTSNIFTPKQTTTLASNYNCIHLCRHHFRNNHCYYRSCLHNKCYTIFKRNTVQDPNTLKPDCTRLGQILCMNFIVVLQLNHHM